MAGVSTKLKQQQGKYEAETRKQQGSIKRQKEYVQRYQAINRIVEKYHKEKAAGKSLKPTYFPKNPNYQKGFRIPGISGSSAKTGQKEGYISYSAIASQSVSQSQANYESAKSKLAQQQAVLSARPSWTQYRKGIDVSKMSGRGKQRSAAIIEQRAKKVEVEQVKKTVPDGYVEVGGTLVPSSMVGTDTKADVKKAIKNIEPEPVQTTASVMGGIRSDHQQDEHGNTVATYGEINQQQVFGFGTDDPAQAHEEAINYNVQGPKLGGTALSFEQVGDSPIHIPTVTEISPEEHKELLQQDGKIKHKETGNALIDTARYSDLVDSGAVAHPHTTPGLLDDLKYYTSTAIRPIYNVPLDVANLAGADTPTQPTTLSSFVTDVFTGVQAGTSKNLQYEPTAFSMAGGVTAREGALEQTTKYVSDDPLRAVSEIPSEVAMMVFGPKAIQHGLKTAGIGYKATGLPIVTPTMIGTPLTESVQVAKTLTIGNKALFTHYVSPGQKSWQLGKVQPEKILQGGKFEPVQHGHEIQTGSKAQTQLNIGVAEELTKQGKMSPESTAEIKLVSEGVELAHDVKPSILGTYGDKPFKFLDKGTETKAMNKALLELQQQKYRKLGEIGGSYSADPQLLPQYSKAAVSEIKDVDVAVPTNVFAEKGASHIVKGLQAEKVSEFALPKLTQRFTLPKSTGLAGTDPNVWVGGKSGLKLPKATEEFTGGLKGHKLEDFSSPFSLTAHNRKVAKEVDGRQEIVAELLSPDDALKGNPEALATGERFGFKLLSDKLFKKKIIEPETGLHLQDLRDQLLKKGASVMSIQGSKTTAFRGSKLEDVLDSKQPKYEYRIDPPSHRGKDIIDLYKIFKTQAYKIGLDTKKGKRLDLIAEEYKAMKIKQHPKLDFGKNMPGDMKFSSPRPSVASSVAKSLSPKPYSSPILVRSTSAYIRPSPSIRSSPSGLSYSVASVSSISSPSALSLTSVSSISSPSGLSLTSVSSSVGPKSSSGIKFSRGSLRSGGLPRVVKEKKAVVIPFIIEEEKRTKLKALQEKQKKDFKGNVNLNTIIGVYKKQKMITYGSRQVAKLEKHDRLVMKRSKSRIEITSGVKAGIKKAVKSLTRKTKKSKSKKKTKKSKPSKGFLTI